MSRLDLSHNDLERIEALHLLPRLSSLSIAHNKKIKRLEGLEVRYVRILLDFLVLQLVLSSEALYDIELWQTN